MHSRAIVRLPLFIESIAKVPFIAISNSIENVVLCRYDAFEFEFVCIKLFHPTKKNNNSYVIFAHHFGVFGSNLSGFNYNNKIVQFHFFVELNLDFYSRRWAHQLIRLNKLSHDFSLVWRIGRVVCQLVFCMIYFTDIFCYDFPIVRRTPRIILGIPI